MKSIRHGSLFSGGGGFELAAERIGWRNVFHCEIDPFCQRILRHYWPNAKSFGDIKQLDAHQFKGKIDIPTGGFPCQPFSVAGKRKGTEDNRYLWPDMLRIIREIRPRYVVGENVYGIVNWNEGLVFEQVHLDLEREDYEVQAFILPAAGVYAPHRRYRVWFIAHNLSAADSTKEQISANGECSRSANFTDADSDRQHRGNGTNEKQRNKGGQHALHDVEQVGSHDTDTNRQGLDGRTKARNAAKERQKTFKQLARLCKRGYWRDWPTLAPICSKHDGLPRELDGITFPRWRQHSVKLYGNAIVPEIAYRIFQMIEQIHAENMTTES